MSYQRCWIPDQVREVFTTESRQKARELFLCTHRPFQRIRVDFCKEETVSGPFTCEEQVRALIEAGALTADNRLFFIVGEAGSGKSELCQWLEYTIDISTRLPIHIPRSMTSAAHVVALLRQHLVQHEEVAALQRVPLSKQADYIMLSAVVLLYEHGSDILTPIKQWEPLLTSDALKAQLMEHLAAAQQGEWTHRLLPAAEYVGDWCGQYGITVTSEYLPTIWLELRHLLTQAMEQALWLGDLRHLLTRLSEQVIEQGRRPLLLLEDVTAFRILSDRLLDYLLDLTSGHFDAVIGVTTGFEKTQLARATIAGDLTHIHHRLRARLCLTDDQGRSYGLEEDVVELARTYLQAVKPDCASCPLQLHCDAMFGSYLYPFTETVLQRAFHNLAEEGNPRQTPRLFIEHVLGAALLSDTIPPITLDQSAYLVPPPALFRTNEVKNTYLQALLRWYGRIGETHISLDRRIATFWDIPTEPLSHGEMFQVDRAYVSAPPDAPVMQEDWHRELRELQEWLSAGGLYPNRETLKRGIERVLFHLGDPRSLASPHALSISHTDICYARGDERLPIFLGQGSGDQPMSRTVLKVQVTGTPAERGILEELAYLELSGAELAYVCRNLALTLAWAQHHWDAYHADIRNLLTDLLGGISVEHFILMAWKMVASLYNILSDPPLDLLSHAPMPHDYATITPWSPRHHWGCYRAGEKLAGWHETIRRLWVGLFTLRDTLIDQARYSAAQNDFDSQTVLTALINLPVPRVRTAPFKIRPTGQKLYDLLVPLQQYAEMLNQLDVVTAMQRDIQELDTYQAHLIQQEYIDLEQLRTHLLVLRWRCGEVGVVWREAWDHACDLFQTLGHDDLHTLRDQVTAAYQHGNALQAASGFDVWAYQRFQHTLRPIYTHPYWSAVTTCTRSSANFWMWPAPATVRRARC
ncbi:MAG: hypothetical protein HC914_19795 [Chloroflexaceae bacterium]|nr:hypothetical protein [Chloroflexaceae bacterium]